MVSQAQAIHAMLSILRVRRNVPSSQHQVRLLVSAGGVAAEDVLPAVRTFFDAVFLRLDCLRVLAGVPGDDASRGRGKQDAAPSPGRPLRVVPARIVLDGVRDAVQQFNPAHAVGFAQVALDEVECVAVLAEVADAAATVGDELVTAHGDALDPGAEEEPVGEVATRQVLAEFAVVQAASGVVSLPPALLDDAPGHEVSAAALQADAVGGPPTNLAGFDA